MHAYRLGFAVKILGEGGRKTSDTRRWQSGPHLRVSLELLEEAWEYLDRIDVRVFRLSSSTIPYGTHPDMPELDYRRQIASCEAELERVGRRARELGLRLSTHPGPYTVLDAPDDELRRRASLDLEQGTALLEALGQGPEAAVVLHVGGLYGDRAAALDRWAHAYERLGDSARARVAVEHDETAFDLDDVLELHRRTGVRVVFDHHHHRCNPAARLGDLREAIAAALDTWPDGQRPKVHVSSPRTELREVGRGASRRLLPPLLDQHADFVTPWDLADVLGAIDRPVDVMLEAKAKDLAVLWARTALERVLPEVAAREERRRPADARSRRPQDATGGQARS
jgi:UV DNA damage endonuclease